MVSPTAINRVAGGDPRPIRIRADFIPVINERLTTKDAEKFEIWPHKWTSLDRTERSRKPLRVKI